MVAIPLEQVQHDDDAQLARFELKRRDQRAVQRFGQLSDVAVGGTLRMKPLERQLRVARERPHLRAPRLEVRQSARDVGGFVPGGVLLNQRNLHASDAFGEIGTDFMDRSPCLAAS